jgi:hypothetical protein
VYKRQQYEWLSRYAASTGLSDLELCIEFDVRQLNSNSSHGWLFDIARSSEEITDDNGDSYFVLSAEKIPYLELNIFQYFHLPTFSISKLQMGELAKEYGFQDIMMHTWFCHNPRKDGSPCGMCAPCKLTRESGLEIKVPNPSAYQLLERYGKSFVRKIRRLLPDK